MTPHVSLNEKIWNGNYLGPEGALETTRALFSQNPEEHLIAYAVALYSARHAAEVLPEYLKIANRVASRAREAFDARDADALDVISTHLLWLARKDVACRYYLTHVGEVCALGIELTEREPVGAHTGSLIRTTYVDHLGPWHPSTRQYLEEAYGRAASITDANQKARVYKRLAKAYACRFDLLTAIECYLNARTVKGIAPDVQKKLSRLS